MNIFDCVFFNSSSYFGDLGKFSQVFEASTGTKVLGKNYRKIMGQGNFMLNIPLRHSELMDVDAKIMNLSFNGLKVKLYLFIEQCEH